MSKERSPFSPGQPVSPEFFVGREEQVDLLTRAIRQAGAGSPQYIFITGERGIGKSSLASLAREIAEKEHNFVGAHALLGGADSLGEVCRRLYQALITQLPDKSLIDRAKKIFERYVDKIDLFGLGVEFKKDARTRASLAENFLPLLAEVNRSFSEMGRRGIVLVADDLNGIAQEAKFGQFIKSTVDQIAVGPLRKFPWLLILVGVRERMDDLKAQQPSVERIFQPVELSVMEKETARVFYERAFQSVNHTWEKGSLDYMAYAGGGFPVMWHELGDAVFWADQDQHIAVEDIFLGIRVAAENVGRKYLKRPLYDELKSSVYQNILDYIARTGQPIRRADAIKELPAKEAKNFDNFIKKMRDLDVLRLAPDKRGEYVFTNFLFFFYVLLQSSARGDENISVKQQKRRK